MERRLIEQACGWSTVQGKIMRTQGACSSLRLALGRRVLATSNKSLYLHVTCLCNGAAAWSAD